MKLKIVALAAAVAAVISSAEAREWRGWNVHPPEYPVSTGMEYFAEQLKERSNGELTAKVFHSGVLGDQPDAIEQVREGALDWAVFNFGPLGAIAPEVNITSLPFIFKDVPSMHKVMDGPVGEEMADGLRKIGLEPLGYFDSGARSFYHREKLIHSPSDITGQKFRVMGNELYVDMIAQLGGNATPMPYADVFQALQTGVIDGAENNYPSYESSGHYEAAKFYSNSQHLILPECLCINKDLFDSLSAEQQALLKEIGREAAELQRDEWAKREEVSKAKVLASGVEIIEIEDKAAFQQLMQPVYDKFLADNPDMAPLIEKVKAAQD
ncbi:TRAP transporter substrate-binding protein [Acuticoccus mangrovi]|uniref:TRAP transporter substrate-binding protein n=1 Tax=Acuticoccus mangrovi TaxID=2796142 RepID=A0A934IP33_9HYPH|nr:TRAP transporter substrate-binding protein [Acuticoccus mangrovi]MBJ3777437.1 TRAP transporter substrate-binding protein [Acuticoccus mangrovi]